MDSALLYGVLQGFPADAGVFAELHGAEPLVLGGGSIEVGQFLFDPVDLGDQLQ